MLGTRGGELKEWGYVALSRARQATRLYLTPSDVELATHSAALDPPEPTERFARALEQSAAERLASEQHSPSTMAARLRPIERQRQTTEQQQAQARQRLATAERELAGLSPLARRRRRPTLRLEIALQRSVLALAEKKLAELERQATAARERATQIDKRPERLRRAGRTRERQREPEPIQLDLGL